MRKLTVYGGTYDGRNRVIVAAQTKKAAYEAVSRHFRVGSYKTWNDYTCETGNRREIDLASKYPLVVFKADVRAMEYVYEAMEG